MESKTPLLLTAARVGLGNARISKHKDTRLSAMSLMVGLVNARISKQRVGLGNARISNLVPNKDLQRRLHFLLMVFVSYENQPQVDAKSML